MNWIDFETGVFSTAKSRKPDRLATLREVLLTPAFHKAGIIDAIQALDSAAVDYVKQKSGLKCELPCFPPSAFVVDRTAGSVLVDSRSGLMQIDFDSKDLTGFNLPGLMKSVFEQLPFIAYAGRSVSGTGFWLLAAIAEPEKLRQYAEHLFNCFEHYGLNPDRSKGRSETDLRFICYDPEALYREEVQPLFVKRFNLTEKRTPVISMNRRISRSDKTVQTALSAIEFAEVGSRWGTVQRSAYTLGGLGDESLLHEIECRILSNPEFSGQHEKYVRCARDCFVAGAEKPL